MADLGWPASYDDDGNPVDTPGEPVELPPPSMPLEVARTITGLRYQHDDNLTLRHWRGGWQQWQTTHWAETEHRAVRAALYTITGNAVYIVVVKDKKGNEVEAEVPWNPNRHKIADLAEALAAITHLPETTAQPQWLADAGVPPGPVVACANGLLHVPTRTLYRHDPRYFSHTAVPVRFDPDAPAPAEWLAFLDALWPGDTDSADALQEFMGYVISGRLDLQKILLMTGPTRGGKGAITRIAGALVGPGNVAGPTLSSLGTDFGLAPLIGKPLAVVSDARLNGHASTVVVERLLSISGEDTITVNIKYRDQWNGKLPCRFILLSNELPHFGDASAAITGRFVILRLTESWLGREDHDLEPRLHAELPGILNWVLDGLDRLARTGRFTRPSYTDDVVLTLANLASPVGAFVRDCCDRGPECSVSVDDIYRAWKNWADDNGQKGKTKQTFGRDLRAVIPELRVGQPVDEKTGKQIRTYYGISLTPAQNGDPRVSARVSGQPASDKRTDTRENPLWAEVDDAGEADAGQPEPGEPRPDDSIGADANEPGDEITDDYDVPF
jgi:putative DNA primase/helicase